MMAVMQMKRVACVAAERGSRIEARLFTRGAIKVVR